MIDEKKVIAMIPIKLNSERVKNKNIREFCDGRPLIQFIESALEGSKYIDKIYVYCSNSEIKNYLKDPTKYLQRPSYLDGNDCNCNDIIREFIKVIASDIYVVSHTTAPFTKSSSIDKCIESVAEDRQFDSSFLVKRVQTFLWDSERALNFDVQHFPRTQDLKPIFTETSGAHVFTRDVFQRYDRRVGVKPCLVEVDEIESIDIDTEEEMQIAQAIYQYRIKENKNEYSDT